MFFTARLCISLFILFSITAKGYGFCLGDIVLELDYWHYETDHFWNKNKKRMPSYNTFKKQAGSVWASYIFSCDDMLSAYGEYDVIHEELNGNTYGFADFEVMWTHALCTWKGGQFYAEILGIIPAGEEKASLRYGRFGEEVDLLYMRSFQICGHEGEMCSRLGYRAYHGFPSDQIRAELGCICTIYDCLYFGAGAQLQYGVFNGKRKENFNTILYNPNFRLLVGEIELLIQPFDWFNVYSGLFGHLWGENVGCGGGWFVGAAADF